jgi:mono/diheme cytochrome c family protein
MKTEQRIVLGILFFFGIILIVGWVAFNEQGRMAEFTQQYEARSIERGATIFESNCSTCHGTSGQGIPSRAPALRNPRLFNGERLAEMGWEGTLENYVQNAITGGRPNSGAYWNGNVMPTWGQEFGGPLRPDQVQDVARFVLNWRSAALDTENPPQVLQDFVLPGVPGAAPAAETGAPEITFPDVASLPVGDVTAGAELYQQLGCVGCHLGGAIAPLTAGTWERVQNRVATAPELAGYSPEQYILESILNPDAYIVPDSPSYVTADGSSLMPKNYRDLINDQGLADLIAYLKSQ